LGLAHRDYRHPQLGRFFRNAARSEDTRDAKTVKRGER
jgi:hypothetical protein